MRIFKLRAECLQDIFLFIEALQYKANNFKIINIEQYPDKELEFETNIQFGAIIEILRSIPDGHVMVQTLSLIEDYTGKRNYFL
jgi:hypothetical protein